MNLDWSKLSGICVTLTFCYKCMRKLWSSRNWVANYFLNIWKDQSRLLKWVTHSIAILIIPITIYTVILNPSNVSPLISLLAILLIVFATGLLYYNTGKLSYAMDKNNNKV